MADFSISLTVDDAHVSRLVDALNWKWNHEADPLTGAQLRDELKDKVIKQLRSAVEQHKEHLRNQTPPADSDVGVT